MLTKSDPDEIQSFLADASYLRGGHVERVAFPETAAEVAAILTQASKDKTQVTVSGAGTGTVGGRVPFGGIVLATEKLSQIKSLIHEDAGGRGVAEAGVRLIDFQQFVRAQGLLYPPDPTERSCFLGGTVATNASGARSFKYGPTRKYVQRLKVVLAQGEVLDLRRGEIKADETGQIRVPLPSGQAIQCQLPEYQMPQVRKHASGYYVEPGMDVLDLFVGSEGTLGVIVEVEVALIRRPERLISGIVFFPSDEQLLAFVREARSRSLRTRSTGSQLGKGEAEVDARALEYFDDQSLGFLRQKYEAVPANAAGAVFFEQESEVATEDSLMRQWLTLLESNGALVDDSWFALNEQEQEKLREFRHQLPVLMNEWFARHRQRKVSTDMAVPDQNFADLLRCYKETLMSSNLRYTIFGHIGDNHVHVNILPRNDQEASAARDIYQAFVRRALELGGTVSAEHGIGKLKRDYLKQMYGNPQLKAMARLKVAFDPAGILGRGNIFSEDYLHELN